MAMGKLVKLKIRDENGNLVNDNVVSASYEKSYSKRFESYINKQWKCCRIFVKIPDEDGNKELDIYYQDCFETISEWVEEIQKYVNEWFNNYSVTIL